MKKTLSLTVLLTLVLALARPAAAQFPAGYERMAHPDHAYDTLLNINDSYHNLYKGNMRVIDLEIDRFQPGSREDEHGNGQDYSISVARVENTGPMQAHWAYVCDYSQEVLDTVMAEMNWRIIDIELNYHARYKSGGVLEPRYSAVFVENTGDQFANWTYIPAMPFLTFSLALNEAIQMDYRPTDIEYVELNGEVYGTALLAHNPTFAFDTFVETDIKYFNATGPMLPLIEADGWQLLDAEKSPGGDTGIEWDYVGIFVRSGLMHGFMNRITKGEQEILNSFHPDRVIDIERNGTVKLDVYYPKSGVSAQSETPAYTTVRLKPGP